MFPMRLTVSVVSSLLVLVLIDIDGVGGVIDCCVVGVADIRAVICAVMGGSSVVLSCR